MKKKPKGAKNRSLPKIALLDKGVVRRIYEYTSRVDLQRPPTDLQIESARAFELLKSGFCRLYVTRQTANILRRRTTRFAAPILAATEELEKGRYHRRWARRLRMMSFSREDGVILAYANFGLDANSNLAEAEAIVTTDLRLISHFEKKKPEIEDRFVKMTSSLSEPYSSLALPAVMSAADVLELA